MEDWILALVPQLVKRIGNRGKEPFEPVFDKVMEAAQAEHRLSPQEWLELREMVKDAIATPKPAKPSRVRHIKPSARNDVVSGKDRAAGEKAS